MRHQRRIADECEQVVGDFGEARLIARNSRRDPVDREGLGRHVALGIEIAVKVCPLGMRLTSSMQPISISRCPW